MSPTLGKLTGTGVVLGPDGTVKGEFTLSADCTPEQADAIARDISIHLEDNDDGHHSR